MKPRLHPIVVLLLLGWIAQTLFFLIVPRLWTPPTATARALVHFSPEQLEVAQRYTAPLRNLGAAATLAVMVALLVLVLTPVGARLADRLLRACGQRVPVAAAAMTTFVIGLQIVINLPFAIARHQYRLDQHMTTQPWGPFSGELAIGAAIVLPAGFLITLLVSWLIARAPRRGWLLATGVVVVIEVVVTAVLPIVIAPLFNKFEPLAQTKWAAQEPTLRALASRAGLLADAPILVADASRQGVEANAYVAGLLGSERIVLYDTLLDHHSPAMVANTLGHELGHWQLGHIRRFVAGFAIATAVGIALLWLLLGASLGRGAIAPVDRHGPRMVLLVFAIMAAAETLSATPIAALSRRSETAADDFGLQLTGDVCSFVDDEKQAMIGAHWDVVPHPLRELLASHPSSVARIERACATVTPSPPCCHHPGL